MTILIVDDQISVVSGLFSGIDWKKIGIQKVLRRTVRMRQKKYSSVTTLIFCSVILRCRWRMESVF